MSKKQKADSEIEITDEHFIDVVGIGLEALWSFFDMVWSLGELEHDQTLNKIGLIGQTLVSEVKMKARAFDKFAEEHCGRIIIEGSHLGIDDAADITWLSARFDQVKPNANVVKLKNVKEQ